MTTMALDLPKQLCDQVRGLVEQGWFSSEEQLVQEAIRRFLEAHTPELMAGFVRADVEWGLKGRE
jgi:Arc/MetJ-type ribon-helix-helix transcriptional regulator